VQTLIEHAAQFLDAGEAASQLYFFAHGSCFPWRSVQQQPG